MKSKMLAKLKTTSVPELELQTPEGASFRFYDLYEFMGIKGCGGFGFVVAAVDRATRKRLALKIVDKNDPATKHHVEMLKKEAAFLEQFDHENIIKMYYLKEFNNYILMAVKLTMENLHDFQRRRRKKGKRLSDHECATIMRGLFQGIDYLHTQRNIIHRDLKPANILIGRYSDLSNVKIIDFGLAVEFSKDNIQDYDRVGTLIYQPPEQINNNYAYGKVIFVYY